MVFSCQYKKKEKKNQKYDIWLFPKAVTQTNWASVKYTM